MVRFTYRDKKYELTFTRETAKAAEKAGLVTDRDAFTNRPVNSLDLLYHYAFMAKHADEDPNVIDEIIPKLKDKDGLVANLLKDFNATYETLIEEPEDEKNAIKWEADD